MTTIERAAQVFGVTLAILAGQLVDMARRIGAVLDAETFETYPAATRETVEVGTLVAVYAHQRIRIARVWQVKGSKLSAVYVTPTEIDAAARYGREVSPNNITAKIADCALVAPAAAQRAACQIDQVDRNVECDAPAERTVRTLFVDELPTCREHGDRYAAAAGIEQGDEPATLPAPVDEPTQPREVAVTDAAYAAGMLPLAGAGGALF